MATNYLPSNHGEASVEKIIYEVVRNDDDGTLKFIERNPKTTINLNNYSFYNYQSIDDIIQEPAGSYMKITYGDETHYIISDGKPFPESNNGNKLERNKSALLTYRKGNYYSYEEGTIREKTNYFYDVASSFMGKSSNEYSTGFSNFTWRSVPGFKIGKRDLTCWTYAKRVGDDEPAFKNQPYGSIHFLTETTPKKFNFSESYSTEVIKNTFGSSDGGTWSIEIDNNKELWIGTSRQGVLDDRAVLVLYYRRPTSLNVKSVTTSCDKLNGRTGTINLNINSETSVNTSTKYMIINTSKGSKYEFNNNNFTYKGTTYSYGSGPGGDGKYFSEDFLNWIISLPEETSSKSSSADSFKITGTYSEGSTMIIEKENCEKCGRKYDSIKSQNDSQVWLGHEKHAPITWETNFYIEYTDGVPVYIYDKTVCNICKETYDRVVSKDEDRRLVKLACDGTSHTWRSNYITEEIEKYWNLTVNLKLNHKITSNCTAPKWINSYSNIYSNIPSITATKKNITVTSKNPTVLLPFSGKISISTANGCLTEDENSFAPKNISTSDSDNSITFSFANAVDFETEERNIAFMLIAITPNDVERDKE